MEKGKTKFNIKDTLVVNLFAGPGAGKSTTAAGIFFELKTKGIVCELASEFAKDLCWEERHQTFNDQIYIFGKQYHRIYRLLGQVDVVITDSPLLLTPIYDSEKRPELETLAVNEHKKMWTYDLFINRVKKFNKRGRNQTEEESNFLDNEIRNVLDKHDVFYGQFNGDKKGVIEISNNIEEILRINNKYEK